MKSKLLYIMLFFSMIIGCQFDGKKSHTGSLPKIDLSKEFLKKEIHIRDIADIEYVPLETTGEVLLGMLSTIQYISDNYIIINDRSEGIFIFNRQGKVISHINRRGNGPEEYTQNGSIIFDEKNEELFVSDALTRRFLVYSISGEYKRVLKYSSEFSAPSSYNIDEETILLYNNDKISQTSVFSEQPYKLMSKKDGSIVSVIDIRLPQRYATKIVHKIDMGGGQIASTSQSILFPDRNNIISYGRDFLIADISSDTIYRLNKNRELTPILTRSPSVHSLELQKIWTTLLTTDKFIFLFTTNLDLVALEQNRNIPFTIIMYEFETGQTYEVSFVSDGYITRYFPLGLTAALVPKNMGAQLLEVHRLKTTHKERPLKDGLEKIIDSLDEDDNPIVAIYKFK